MKLILLRHGDRSPGFSDVPLSEKGHHQAHALAQNDELHSVTHIWCSPKRRAQQTVEPLAKSINLAVQTKPELDQMRQIESGGDFTRRIGYVLDALPRSANDTYLLCSHSDWLQQAVLLLASEEQLFSPYAFFSCAEYKIFYFENNQWNIR